MSARQTPTAYSATRSASDDASGTDNDHHQVDLDDDASSECSSDESPLPTPYTATVPTFDIHTPDRRDSVMSSSSDLRAGRSSSDSDRIRITPRRSRRKDKGRAAEPAGASLADASATIARVELGGPDGCLSGPFTNDQTTGNVPMPSFARSRSNGRTPRALQVEHAPAPASLDVALSDTDASYTAGPSTAPPSAYTYDKPTTTPLTALPGSPNPKGLIPGLNISLPSSTISHTFGSQTDILPTPGEEASDVLSSLVPSPRKAFLNQLHSYESRADKARAEGDVPITPTWGSFDPVKPAYPAPPAYANGLAQAPHVESGKGLMGPPPVPAWTFGNTSSAARPVQGGRGSMAATHAKYLDPDGPSPKSGAPATFDPAPLIPAALPSPAAANGTFSPTPNHGIHSRNLSIHFPRPGQPVQAQRSSEDLGRGEAPVATAGRVKEAFNGSGGGFAFGATLNQGKGGEGQKAGKRRGHHHKHSLSHNFFSFLDPTKTDSTLDDPSHPSIGIGHSPAHGRRQSSVVSRKVSDTPLAVPMPLSDSSLTLNPNAGSFASLNASSSRGSIASITSLTGFTNKSDPMSQLLSSFALLEFMLGAALWVEGQMSGYRSLAGLGYMVVFDAFGVGVGVVARGGEGWRSVRTPYGMTRFLSLLYFSQCLFLVFSAVYIAKESLEQVVLGGHEHGGHSHGHADHEDESRGFPITLLLCATVASAMGGGVMHTHAKLVDAVGSLFLSSTYLSSPIVKRFPHLLANPFSLTIAAASLMLLMAGLLLPEDALPTLDGFAALVLTVLTTSLALPPTKAFGRVLLQTAPPATTTQMRAFTKAIKEIKGDRRVVGLRQTRCWAVTAGSAPPAPPVSPAMPGTSGLHESPPMTPSASSSNLLTLGAFGGSGAHMRKHAQGDGKTSRDHTAPPSPSLHGHAHHPTDYSGQPDGLDSRPSLPRRSSSAWYSPQHSPTVGEFGGVSSSLYPSLRGKGEQGDAPLVITVMLQVDKDMGDNEVMQLTRDTWGRLSKVGGVRRVGEVCVGVERVE